MIQVNKSDIRKWVKALRSGKYSKTTGVLQDSKGYCCLGVGCDVFIPKSKQELHDNFLFGAQAFQQKNSPNWLTQINQDFHLQTGSFLTNLNDGSHTLTVSEQLYFNFDEIADLLELVYIHEILKVE